MNQGLSSHILSTLQSVGVTHFCVCPGGQNAPFVVLLQHLENVQVHYFPNEQNASFFALGLIKRLQEPVVVITTSGSAVAQLLPATMEAYYTQLPLILLTADRPKALWGTGAPQTAEAETILSTYAPTYCHLELEDKLNLKGWDCRSPLHLNVSFEEPLVANEPVSLMINNAVAPHLDSPLDQPDKKEIEAITQFLNHADKLMIIVGELDSESVKPVSQFLAQVQVPVLLEPLSQLCSDSSLASLSVSADIVSKRFQTGQSDFDAVLRIGGVSLSRVWRDITKHRRNIKILSVSQFPFSGMPDTTLIHSPNIGLLLSSITFKNSLVKLKEPLILASDEREIALKELYSLYPRSEPALIYQLSKFIPEDSRLFLGNSLPIREWDSFADQTTKQSFIQANRGINGIDGQISTFLGWCQNGSKNYLIVGDLTFFYDLSAFWNLAQLPDFTIIVINNQGGRIFEHKFPNYPEFINSHQFELKPIAQLWGLHYEQWDELPSSWPKTPYNLIELRPNTEQTTCFWKEYRDAIKNSL